MLIKYDEQDIEMSDKYSFKDFSQKDLSKDIIKNINIYASNFYRECLLGGIPGYVKVFPDTMTGVKFYNCNLNNVEVPSGNTIIDPCNRHKLIKEQNDRIDWILNEDTTPKQPIPIKEFLAEGISTKPGDIPPTPLPKDIITMTQMTKDVGGA